MRTLAAALTFLMALAIASAACDDDGQESTGIGKWGFAGSDGGAGITGAAANSGTAGATGAGEAPGGSGGGSGMAGRTGAGGSPGTGGGGAAMGTQPIGSLCANDANCTQSGGAAVCCVNTCTSADQCPSNPMYLQCSKGADCAPFGGDKICCEAGGMRFCTKQSTCSAGRVLP